MSILESDSVISPTLTGVEETKSSPETSDGSHVSLTVNVTISEGSDTQEYAIPREIALKFLTISDLILESPDSTDTFPFIGVEPAQFKQIMSFYEQYLDLRNFIRRNNSFTPIAKPIPSEKLEDCGVPKWACEAVDLPLTDEPVEMIGRYSNLYKLFMAASYLNAVELLDVISAKFACLIKSAKSPEAQRKLWAIPNDFDSEDEFVMEEVEVVDEDEDGNPIKVKREEKRWIKITEETHKSFYSNLPI